MPISTLATAASSPEFDRGQAGFSADELRQTALKGLRYLCFTHDTGPEDCVRPKESWGRTEPAGTKWGERGVGFFRESQCGRTIATLALTAALVKDLLGGEEREMLASIAADYMKRFGEMPPHSGVYVDTQTEENAWTALGMVACMALLPGHERAGDWAQLAKRWMFCTSTVPRDARDDSEFAGGKTVRELCGCIFTTLPDGTAENHGFVHPNYMGSAISLGAFTATLLELYGQAVPPHLFRRRRDTYDLLKGWCDSTGAPLAVQGMDWPYFGYPGYCALHAVANVYLKDPDAALLERRALEIVQRVSAAHGGRMVPEATAKHCHGQQDPALMRERMIMLLAQAYLMHRLMGEGESPPSDEDFERQVRGVRVYPHGGAVVHRHAYGITSFSWRNRTMVLPGTREGQKLIGPAGGSMLAEVQVKGKAVGATQVALKIREAEDRVCALLVEDLCEDSVRREVFFASLPGGKCLTAERLFALDDVLIESVRQGYLSIINDGYFGRRQDLRGERRIFWDGGQRAFSGYASDSEQDDEILDLAATRWVNVDDRCGLVFQGTGRALYRNRHYWQVWRAVEDDLMLSVEDSPQSFEAGQTIARLVALWCPEQTHDRTARQELKIHEAPGSCVAAEVDGFLCACNFGREQAELPVAIVVRAGRSLPVAWGVSAVAEGDLTVRFCLAAKEPAIIALGKP